MELVNLMDSEMDLVNARVGLRVGCGVSDLIALDLTTWVHGEGNYNGGLEVRSHAFSGSEMLDRLSQPLNYTQNMVKVSTKCKRHFHFTVS